MKKLSSRGIVTLMVGGWLGSQLLIALMNNVIDALLSFLM